MKGQPLEIIGQPPIACCLDSDAKIERSGDWRELLETSLIRREKIDNGMRLYFQPAAEDAVRELAGLEKECCAFFTFVFDREPGALVLFVTAPPEAGLVLEGLFDSSSIS